MKVLVTGANGQLGSEMQDTKPAGIELLAVDIAELDITDAGQVSQYIKSHRPDVIVNAAAYTAVDKAESDHEIAFRVNADAVGYLADAVKITGARFVQVSTDFVFDGDKPRPYLPDDKVNPLGVYGASKERGEVIAREMTDGQALIVRTAWVYSTYGHNFVKTMLKLMAEREELSVVADQIGTPTWANGLAHFLWKVTLEKPELSGTCHWTDAGVASWYDFAVVIQSVALELGLLARKIPIYPIPAAQYPTPARRPSCGVLDKSSSWEAVGDQGEHWSEALKSMLTQYRKDVVQ